MHTGSVLPVAGGIVRRAQLDSVPKPRTAKVHMNHDMAHAAEEYKRGGDIAVAA